MGGGLGLVCILVRGRVGKVENGPGAEGPTNFPGDALLQYALGASP
jgi:hypothetical protein